jgi:hypothetical protein
MTPGPHPMSSKRPQLSQPNFAVNAFRRSAEYGGDAASMRGHMSHTRRLPNRSRRRYRCRIFNIASCRMSIRGQGSAGTDAHLTAGKRLQSLQGVSGRESLGARLSKMVSTRLAQSAAP